LKKVIIIGASGHGKVIADIVKASGDKFVGYLDDNETKKTLGKTDAWKNYSDCSFIIGIGNAEVRKKISNLPINYYTAIHPSAIVSETAKIGEGTVIMPNAVVNADSAIGKHCIINTSAVVEHDNIIGDYSHISVGAKLGGNVSVGNSTWIGIGAAVKNNVTIAGNVVVGTGAVVVKSISESGTYVGVPARKMDIKNKPVPV